MEKKEIILSKIRNKAKICAFFQKTLRPKNTSNKARYKINTHTT